MQIAEELQCHVTLNYTFNQLRYYQQNDIFVICLRFIELSSDWVNKQCYYNKIETETQQPN